MTPRVVVLTPYYAPVVGGAESSAERLARYLHGIGLNVRVLTKRIGRDLPDEQILGGVPVERIGPYGERSASGKWQVSPAAAAWLLRHRRDHDVVCAVDYRGVGFAALIARAFTGRPVVLQAQTTGVLSGDNIDPILARWGVSAHGAPARLIKMPARLMYGGGDAFACISHDIERETLASGIPRERVHFLPNAVDFTRFRSATDGERAALRRERGIPEDVLVCLFVGRLSREKGLMELIEAWNLLQPANALLLVAGPDMTGHPWDVGVAARDFVARHNLTASTRFLGSIADVAPLLRVADIVVQPSHFEALGLSAIEALASGVPVVASAVGGLLDFVVDDVNGKLAAVQNPAALADAIGILISDEPLRRRLAAQARASVQADYDEREVFGRFAALLTSLAGTAR
jgi:glycosyltransferase involved in cell wall biosynthesis